MTENPIQKCRTCLKNSTKYLGLDKYVTGCKPKITYGQLLKKYANFDCLSLDYERYMPQYLCLLCCRDLRNAYDFLRQAQCCNNKLINVIAKQLASLQEKAINLPLYASKLEQHPLTIKKENSNEEGDFGANLQDSSCTSNEFRIVNTSVLLKSEVLEETPEPEGAIQYYVDEFEDSEEVQEGDRNELNEDSIFENSTTSNTKDPEIDTVCPICDKTIGKHDNLVTHMHTQHDFQVPRELLNLQRLRRTEQEEQDYPSSKCTNKTNDSQERIRENRGKPRRLDRVLKCNLCDYATRHYAGLNFHYRSKHGSDDDKFKCKFCPYTTCKKFSLIAHVKNLHKDLIKTLKAVGADNKEQGESLNNGENTINKSITTPDDDTSSDDDHDEAPLTQKPETPYLNNEIKDEDEQEALSDEMFIRNIFNIKKRQVNTISTRSLPQRCDICGNIYNNYRALMTHQKNVHISEEKYSLCTHCGKKIKKKANLRVHIKNVHMAKDTEETGKAPSAPVAPKEKRFMCTECFYVCGTITTLNIHRRRHHTGEKPYKCDICSKSFLIPYDMKIHRYLHTGERPYKCPFCSKGFRNTAQLVKHKRIHNNERPYKCKECGKSFTQSYNLSLHKRVHLKEKKLNCTVCDRLFENLSELNIHRINENHPDVVDV